MINMKTKQQIFKILIYTFAAVMVFSAFLISVSRIKDGHIAEGKEQLEESIRRTAAACYAAEGIYPPDVEYMEEHYGIRINEKHYAVKYELIASNLMPDITVLELEYEE